MNITYNQASYIMHYTKPHKFEHYFCNYTIVPLKDGYFISCDMKWPVFILLYIPVSILELIYYLIYEGISNYIPLSKTVDSYLSSKYDYATKRVEEVIPCFTCGYYHKENNTCNIKKCSGYGIGYVTKSDQSTCTFFTKQE